MLYILQSLDQFEGKLATGTAKAATGFALDSTGNKIVNAAGQELKINAAGNNVEFA